MSALAKVRTLLAAALVAPLLLALAACGNKEAPATAAVPELKVLAWVGYDEAPFLDPIAKELGAKIVVKTYVGGDEMYSLFKAAPADTYDVVVVDAEYGRKMFREGLLKPLGKEVWSSPNLFQPFDSGAPAKENDSVYGAVVRWGALGLVYNRNKISAEQASDYKILWDDSVKGRVGLFDWYLPNMGVLSRNLGNPEPYALAPAALARLRQSLLDLRPQVRAIHKNTGDVIADLRNEEVYVTPGVGEWAAAVLAEEDKPIDWSVPKQGGVMWVEALAVPTASKKHALAEKFIQAVRRPTNSANLAWRRAYHSQVPSKDAYAQLSDTQRALLKAQDLDQLQGMIGRLSIRQLPGPDTVEADWVRIWTEFKAGTN